MRVMPANSSGWFWHCLARETGRIGHLFSPQDQRGPWPWLPYALDNGAFSCWNMKTNEFDEDKWEKKESHWRELIYWARTATQQPLWAIAPDVIGNATKTIARYSRYAGLIKANGLLPAVAVQDGMSVQDVKRLIPEPVCVCIGGTTEWKWETVEMWKASFERVHVLRCNSPEKLYWLEELGIESCDGTGWNRGDKRQTSGLETWARQPDKIQPMSDIELYHFTCRSKAKKDKQKQLEWAWFSEEQLIGKKVE